MKRFNELSRSIRLGLALGTVATATAPMVVVAQDDQGAETLETITVVGSRIKRTDIETSQPVFVLEREDLQRTGLTSIGDVLQDLTTNGATLNTTFNNGGNGETRVDLRNLGANRTLVLVNGRRWVSTLDGAVDLNTIPVSIIERVEVLKDGASAIYGSDAIAGVVNITTRDNFDGAEASAYVGENEEGDGRAEAYDFTVGAASDRASAVLNASYVKQEPIFAGDREVSAVPTFGLPATSVLAGASSTTRFGRFGRVGVPGTVTLIPGRTGTAATDFQTFSLARDGFNFAPENYLQTPQERTAVYGQVRYELTETITFRAETLFNQRRSEQYLAPTPLTLSAAGIFASPINRNTVVTVPADNVFNPFGRDVNRLQIRMPDSLPRRFFQDVDTFRFASGFNGAFDFADRSFSWDVNYSFSESEQNDTTSGLLNLQRVAQALGPNFRDGNVVRCGTPTAPITGCVPLNPFGGSASITQEMLDYISFIAHDEARNKMYNYSANLTGDLFELPAGPLSFAAGYEYRRENAFSVPDALTSSGVSSGNQAQPVSGQFDLNEFYVEFNVPVLSDAPLAKTLEFSVAARASDYSSFGDTTNPKFGFRWKPIDDVLVRGNFAEGFRAPNISELFSPAGDAYPTVFDPCDANNLALSEILGTLSSRAVAQVIANCRAGGVPAGYTQANTQIRTTVGGNADLTPETSTSKTLGIVYSPSWIEGLDLYLDWYSIDLENTIGGRGAAALVDACYVTSNFNTNSDACRALRRNAEGFLVDINAPTLNEGATEIEGYDFTVNYRFDTSFGRFSINWDNAYVSKYDNQVEAGAEFDSLVGNYFDRFPVWRLRSNISTNWQYGDWGATLSARYFSALDENCFLVAQAAYYSDLPELENLCSNPNQPGEDFAGGAVRVVENQVEDTWYFDLQATWDAPWNGRVTAGVRNLLDEDPPLAFDTFANTFDPQYEVPGRFWYVQYRQRF